jgi:NADH dehydrogenase FAD-containing subunit
MSSRDLASSHHTSPKPVSPRIPLTSKLTLRKKVIPYNNLFGPTPNHHRIIHGTVTKLEQNKVTYTPAPYSTTSNETKHSLEFDYLIYALGAKLPGPIDFWAKSVYDVDAEKTVNLDFEKEAGGYDGSKSAAIAFLQRAQKRLRTVESVLVVGGGALGIRMSRFHTQVELIVIVTGRICERFEELVPAQANHASPLSNPTTTPIPSQDARRKYVLGPFISLAH